MRAKSEAGFREHRLPEVGAHFSHWEGAQVLLAVIRNGSLRRAADAMSIPVMVARRRIEDFEREIGASLFIRDGRGTRLTPEGEQVFSAVERMEAASLDLVRTQNSTLQSLAGTVRLRVTDSLGSFWLAPRLGEFQRAFPRILIDLDCIPGGADDMLQENDIALTLGKPLSGAEPIKLGRIHSMLFASPGYIEAFGAPASFEDVMSHRLVSRVSGYGEADDIMKKWFPDAAADDLLVMRTNASSAHYWAIAQGVGLGALPTYLAALGSHLVPLEVGLNHADDVWLSCHSQSSRLPRVRRMIDWIVQAFDPLKYHWFRDEFIHPNQLAGLYTGTPLTKLFDSSWGGGR